MKNWINRHITHNRDDEGDFGIRVLLHIPIGFLMGLTAIIPFLGYGLLQLFLKYERNEDVHTQDEAWKDIFGAIVGYSISTIIILIGLGIGLAMLFP